MQNQTSSAQTPRKRGAMIAAGSVGAIAVVLAGFGAARFNEDQGATRPSGRGLQIELVAPTEPAPDAGDIMDVGEVTDGFVYVRADMRPEPIEPVTDYWVDEPAYDPAPPPPPSRYADGRAVAVVYPLVQDPRPVEAPEIRRADRSFGFDRPRPDYRALREARRARLDALAQRSSERSRAWETRSDAGVMPPEALRRSDSTFY